MGLFCHWDDGDGGLVPPNHKLVILKTIAQMGWKEAKSLNFVVHIYKRCPLVVC